MSTTEMYMKQKISIISNYKITDTEDNPIYQVKGNITGMRYNITNAVGEPVAEIKKKISLQATYNVDFANGDKIELKKKVAIVKEAFNGTYNDQTLTMKGDFIAFNFEVHVGDTLIGTMKKEVFHLTDTYKITVTSPEWQDVMAVVAVCMDSSCHRDN